MWDILGKFTAVTMIAAISASAPAQPAIPTTSLPKDAPERVRSHVEKLYSADVDVRHQYAKGAGGFRGREAELVAPFLAAMIDDDSKMMGTTGGGYVRIIGRDGEFLPGGKILIGLTPGQGAVEGLAAMGAPAVEPLLNRIAALDRRALTLRPDPRQRDKPSGGPIPQVNTCTLRERMAA